MKPCDIQQILVTMILVWTTHHILYYRECNSSSMHLFWRQPHYDNCISYSATKATWYASQSYLSDGSIFSIHVNRKMLFSFCSKEFAVICSFSNKLLKIIMRTFLVQEAWFWGVRLARHEDDNPSTVCIVRNNIFNLLNIAIYDFVCPQYNDFPNELPLRITFNLTAHGFAAIKRP